MHLPIKPLIDPTVSLTAAWGAVNIAAPEIAAWKELGATGILGFIFYMVIKSNNEQAKARAAEEAERTAVLVKSIDKNTEVTEKLVELVSSNACKFNG